MLSNGEQTAKPLVSSSGAPKLVRRRAWTETSHAGDSDQTRRGINSQSPSHHPTKPNAAIPNDKDRPFSGYL